MTDQPRFGVWPLKAKRRRPEPAHFMTLHESQPHYGRAKLSPKRPQAGVRRFKDAPYGGQAYSRPVYGLIPENDYQATADTVYDNPRGPSIVPTGVLDSRGQMLCRVSMPIKVKMGFHSMMEDVADEMEMIVPEDMLRLSDCGAGMAHVDDGDFELEDEDEGEDDEG